MSKKTGIEVKGCTYFHYFNGLLHRENDLPAMYVGNNYFEWRVFGKKTRSYGLPSVMDIGVGSYSWSDSDGNRLRKVSGLHGCLIIGDKEECTSFTGTLEKEGVSRTYENGSYHRGNDMPARVTKRGAMCWYVNGKMGRGYGLPCLITDSGARMWFEKNSKGVVSQTQCITLEELNGALVIGLKDLVG